MKLDKSKPYGEVINDSQGRRYEQDGRYFDGLGNEIVEKAKPAPKGKPAKAEDAPAPEGTANDDQIAAQLGG